MNESWAYFIRRLILTIPTFLGITIFCFFLIQLVPGGPVEQMISKIRMGNATESGGSGGNAGEISEDQLKAIRKHFGYDKPILVRYYDWLIVNKIGLMADSYKFNNKKVWQLVKERLPISLTFGICGFILTYLICIPLGIAKALRNGNSFDLMSSLVVFVLYAIPSFAFGMILKFLFCGINDWSFDFFPIGGFRSENWEQFTFFGKISDQVMHMFLPVMCYVIGSFAFLTLLQKNSLLEQMSQDYIRTVLAKGGTKKRAIWVHALRNSLIPIATTIGGNLSLILASSVLIEKVFNIPGIGYLSLDAIIYRDYMVFMGILSLTAILNLLGRIISDACFVLIDPRINFEKD